MSVSPARFHWKFKPLAVLDQAAPVFNQWYTVLDTTSKIRLYSISLKQVNDEIADKGIGVQVIIDGVTTSASSTTCGSGVVNYSYLNNNLDGFAIDTPIKAVGYYVALHGKSIKVQVKNTSALGTNQRLYGYVRYAQLEVI